MKTTTNTKLKLWTCLLLLLAGNYMRAQVTIGSDNEPAKAAILQIKSQEPNAKNETSTSGGLLFSRVELQSLTSLMPFIPDAQLTTEAKKHTGLVVYNLKSDASFTPGLYVWDGAKWVNASLAEPWHVQGGSDKLATANTENIYQVGKVAIGSKSSGTYTLQVTGNSNITLNSRVGSSTVVGAESIGSTLTVGTTSHLKGFVGINTAPATYNLNVNGTSNVSGNSRMGSSTVVSWQTVGTTQSVGTNLTVGGTSHLKGMVGINTAPATHALSVAGNTYTTGISKVGGTTATNASAQIELGDNNKGLLLNRVTLTSLTAKAPVNNAVVGMFVYNTASNANVSPGLHYWDGSKWVKVGSESPPNTIKMYYQTRNIVGGPANGVNQSQMRSLQFSATGRSHSPVTIKLPESGSYAFNVKLYSNLCDKNTETVGSSKPTPSYPGIVIVYLGIWVNGTLQDVSEVFFTIGKFATSNSVVSNANVSNVILGCTGKAGDTIDIRFGYYQLSIPEADAVVSQGKTASNPISDRTSMIFWKL